MRHSAWGKLAVTAIAVVLLGLYALGWYWSREPDTFSVVDVTKEETDAIGGKVVVGSTTTATLIYELETLLNKPGGFLSNDVTSVAIFLDNIPAWEYGVLLQARDITRAMRDSIARSQSQSKEDTDLALAESRLNISHTAWVFPDAESEYRDGIKYLRKYLVRLSKTENPDAQFYARADNLRHWLGIAEVRLGSLSQRLTASVGDKQGKTVKNKISEPGDKTDWFEIDDVFYEARGSAWALLHLLQAVRVDFADVLNDKNAMESVDQIIRELEATQEPLTSPMVLNGSGFGLWANHSLVMASYLSRANAAIIDLRELLEKG